MSLGHSRLLVHRLPTADRVFGMVGLGMVDGVRGDGAVGTKGGKVVGLEEVSLVVGVVVRRGTISGVVEGVCKGRGVVVGTREDFKGAGVVGLTVKKGVSVVLRGGDRGVV